MTTDFDLAETTKVYAGRSQYSLNVSEFDAAAVANGPKKPAPINVDEILTKTRDITVGTVADSPGAHTQNEAEGFIPASITKVLTTSVALKKLGPDFKFRTIVTYRKDSRVRSRAVDVVIVADGDPTVGFESFGAGDPFRMRRIVALLKSDGITEIQGPIRLQASDGRLDVRQIPTGIPDEDLNACYGSTAGAFNYIENCAYVRVHGETGVTWEAGVADWITTRFSTRKAEKNGLGVSPLLSDSREFSGFVFGAGSVAAAPRVWNLQMPIPNAIGIYGRKLLEELRLKKIVVRGTTLQFSKPGPWVENESGFTIESAPLAKIVEATNKPSDNFLADSILKAVGLRMTHQQNLVAGGLDILNETIERWLRAEGHAAWSREMSFHDGAGLSAESRASPRAFLAVLRQIAKEPSFPALWDSLPVAGAEGTLGGRMLDTKAEGRVRAKTGTLRGSYQLVGYIPKTRGTNTEYVPFVILTSTAEKNRDRVRRFQDALVAGMADAVEKE